MTQELKQWRYGNNAGRGFAIGLETDSPRGAAERDGYRITQEDAQGNVLAVAPNGDTTVICDVGGPWAVIIKIKESGGL